MSNFSKRDLASAYMERKGELKISRKDGVSPVSQRDKRSLGDDEQKVRTLGEVAYPVSQMEKALLANEDCRADYIEMRDHLKSRDKLYSFMQMGLFVSQSEKLLRAQTIIKSMCERTDKVGETARAVAQQAIGTSENIQSVCQRNFYAGSILNTLTSSFVIQSVNDSITASDGPESFFYRHTGFISDNMKTDARNATNHIAGAQYFFVLGL